MLRSLKTIEGYVVSATDGEVGRVASFLFDDVARSESDGPRTRERKAHIGQDLRSPKSRPSRSQCSSSSPYSCECDNVALCLA
jgi:hypothetical protein